MRRTIAGVSAAVVLLALLLSLSSGCSGTDPPEAERPQRIAAGVENFAVDDSGQLWFWGMDLDRSAPDVADGPWTSDNPPEVEIVYSTPYVLMDGVSAVSAGEFFAMILTDSDDLWVRGYFPTQGMYTPDSTRALRPLDMRASHIGAAGLSLLVVDEELVLWEWGTGGYIWRMIEGQQSGPIEEIPVRLKDDIIFAAPSSDHVLAIDTDHTLWSWGTNTNGQLGRETNLTGTSIPNRVMTDVVYASAGRNISAAIRADGTLWLWGKVGKTLAPDGGLNTDDPVAVAENVRAVAVEEVDHQSAVLYITEDDVLWCLGYNLQTREAEPEPVKLMEDVDQISLFQTHVLVLTRDGRLFGWGDSTGGTLPGADADYVSEPVEIVLE